ncbi:Hint domain-containing protein (plasmid) [Tistrella mobilis]|uniref:Hint domain-containing protein n=1 Tax=Tistrella mobilis TaxID=171437 RepID=UPI003556ED98
MSRRMREIGVDRFGRMASPMSKEEAEVFQTVTTEAAATPNGVMSLDMRNETHRRFILDRFGGDDYLERYFPSTRRLIKLTEAHHQATGGPRKATLLEMDDPQSGSWVPAVTLTYLGVEPNSNQVSAQGIVTLTGISTVTALNLILVDNHTGQQIGSSSIPQQYNSTTQVVELTSAASVVDGKLDVTATLSAAYMPAGATALETVVATADLRGVDAIDTLTVVDPNHNSHPTRDYIKVGLNRTDNQVGDCDYYYQYGNDGSKPIVGLAVNGSATLLQGYTVAANPNFNGNCILFRRSGQGDGATLAFPSADIPPLCTGAGGAISWAIGPDWLQGAPWDQGQTIDLDFLLNFSLSTGETAFIRVTSVPLGVTTPPANIGMVAPIQFVWGCVAEGSLVELADGTARPIESLTAGERVADGMGGSLRIAEVWRGTEDKPMVRVVTDTGAEVLLTHNHPVPTAAGVVVAEALETGAMVTTDRGSARVTLVERVSHDGRVFNLDLLPDGAESLADIHDDAITGFIAGGILVGDNRMQAVHAARAALPADLPDPVEILGQTLGDDWRLDVTNARRIAAGLAPIARIDG